MKAKKVLIGLRRPLVVKQFRPKGTSSPKQTPAMRGPRAVGKREGPSGLRAAAWFQHVFRLEWVADFGSIITPRRPDWSDIPPHDFAG